MNERKHKYEAHPWDDSVYGTGSTQPPKNRGGLMALLLVIIIFLCGIITVLSILNVRLFQQLSTQEEENLPISFSVTEEETTEPTQQISETGEAPEAFPSIDLQASPKSVDNLTQEGALSLQEIYRKNIGSVVSITCSTPSGNSTGTGVVVSQDGYIVTNAHVVEDAVTITIQLTDDRLYVARLVGADSGTDLAVLTIDARDLTVAEFGDSDQLQVGDSVAAIGDPLGVEFRGTLTDGIVSAINRDVTVNGYTMTLIQTNAALNSGNSGGPLINCYGQVVGINTMKIGAFTDSAGVEGLGFAIPSSTVKDITEQLINQGYVSGRPTLGIQGDTLSTFYQYYYHMPPGLYITGVAGGSSADRCGIEEGDILVSINEVPIISMEELNANLYGYAVGETVTAVIYRGGYQYTVELTLTENKG